MLKIRKSFYCILLAAALMLPGQRVVASNIRDLENQSNSVQQQITEYESELVNVLAQIQVLEGEIYTNEIEIADAEANLADAIAAKEEKYRQMCSRIKYNYEHKDESMLAIILTAQSFSDFLNQIEYANSIYEYDSQMLDSYEALCMDIEALRLDLESRRAELSVKREQLAQKQSSLNTIIADARARKADIDHQIQVAKEEAARRAAEEARRRAELLAAQSAASANANIGGNKNPSPVTNVSGQAVIDYANQFVGGKYVWGGNSLTNGVDCSGFVVQIYKHFGIDLSGSRHTSLLEKVGQAVSYNNMQPGDIVCYSGHVGLYMGNGCIVEAQSSRAGITNNRSVNNKTILAIRRVI